VLREIRERGGVHLVVDDLGAGYSNLRRIADLEPAIVKLDRELVTNLNHNRRQRVLVQAVVRMCVDLGAKVVAEGLETWDEVRAARDCGCHFGQGFVLGRPEHTASEPIWKT
jgi:EAL domain-containing protein (putative c-di-GMP-specific phosphodiesterase class I)